MNVTLHANLAPDDPALANCLGTFEESETLGVYRSLVLASCAASHV